MKWDLHSLAKRSTNFHEFFVICDFWNPKLVGTTLFKHIRLIFPFDLKIGRFSNFPKSHSRHHGVFNFKKVKLQLSMRSTKTTSNSNQLQLCSKSNLLWLSRFLTLNNSWNFDRESDPGNLKFFPETYILYFFAFDFEAVSRRQWHWNTVWVWHPPDISLDQYTHLLILLQLFPRLPAIKQAGFLLLHFRFRNLMANAIRDRF